MHVAAREGHLDVFHELLREGIPFVMDVPSPLYIAAEQGHVDIIREILDAGVRPNRSLTRV